MSDKIIIGNAELVEYKGTWSLIAVREYNGNYYQQWGRLEMGKDKKLSEKSQPFKVVLGDKDTAILALKTMIEKIGGQGDDSVPF